MIGTSAMEDLLIIVFYKNLFIFVRKLLSKSKYRLWQSPTCVSDVLEIINCRNCRTWLFFNKYAHEHTFQFREYVGTNFEKLGVHVL